MRKSLFLISLVLSSAACSQAGEETKLPAAFAQEQGSLPEAPNPPKADAAKPVSFEDNASEGGATRAFAYSWSAEVARIPELATRFEAERDRQLAAQKDQWRELLTEFPGEDCTTCKTLGSEVEWQVIADLPDFLSLSADVYLYTGGAHGLFGVDTMVWDKRAGAEIEGGDFFVSTMALENALGTKLCDALDRERAKRRGMPVERNDEWSTDCPSLSESTVLVGSSNGKTFDRIGVYFGPYTAGSYAEGAYELDFPVTASILDAVKPKYARAFSVQR